MKKFLKFSFFAGFVVLAYMAWKFQTAHERVVVDYGIVKAKSRTGNQEIIGRTRRVQQGPAQFEEVELPSKLWLACKGDCSDALRRATLDANDNKLGY